MRSAASPAGHDIKLTEYLFMSALNRYLLIFNDILAD